MALRLYRRHDPASETKHQDAKQLARAQGRILAGTPGTLKQRTQSGNKYWMREYIRSDGKKTDEYIGPIASVDESRIERIRQEIELAKALAASSATLRLFGYQRIDRRPAAVLEALFNRGLLAVHLPRSSCRAPICWRSICSSREPERARSFPWPSWAHMPSPFACSIT